MEYHQCIEVLFNLFIPFRLSYWIYTGNFHLFLSQANRSVKNTRQFLIYSWPIHIDSWSISSVFPANQWQFFILFFKRKIKYLLLPTWIQFLIPFLKHKIEFWSPISNFQPYSENRKLIVVTEKLSPNSQHKSIFHLHDHNQIWILVDQIQFSFLHFNMNFEIWIVTWSLIT